MCNFNSRGSFEWMNVKFSAEFSFTRGVESFSVSMDMVNIVDLSPPLKVTVCW